MRRLIQGSSLAKTGVHYFSKWYQHPIYFIHVFLITHMILCTSIPKYLPISFLLFFPPQLLCDLSAFSENISESKLFSFFPIIFLKNGMKIYIVHMITKIRKKDWFEFFLNAYCDRRDLPFLAPWKHLNFSCLDDEKW